MIRFIHTADVHFGMENYGRIDPKTGIHSRLLDFERAFNICIDYAIEHNVDFFLFSGDAYKTTNPSPTQQKLFFKSLFRLHEKGIPIVMVIGNHDNPLSFGKSHTLDLFNELPLSGFYVISKPELITLNTKNGPVTILGIPWPTRNTISMHRSHETNSSVQITEYISQAVAHIIQDMSKKIDPNVPAVLAAHLTVSSGIFSGSEKRAIYGTDPILLPSQLALPIFDYVALGHLHRYQNLNENGYPAIVYSGSIERIDFGERKEEKGFCVVSIDQKGKTTHEFIKVPTRPFIQIDVNLSKDRSQTEQIIDALKEHDLDGAVLKIVYHLSEDQQDTVDLNLLQKECENAWHIVGIIPVRKFEARERRSIASSSSDFTTLLATYFDSKPTLKPRSSELIEKILLLQQEVMEEADSCGE